MDMVEVRRIKIKDIEPNMGQIAGVPKNPRRINKKQLEALMKSLEQDPELEEMKEIWVKQVDGKYVAVDGNMRIRAHKEMGHTDCLCKIIPDGWTPMLIKRAILKANATYGDWDEELLAGDDWGDVCLADCGLDLPDLDSGHGSHRDETDEDAVIERKKREFEEKMANGELSEDDLEYQAFLEKFEAKKTTDDCYTPEVVYDAVADWVASEYNLSRANFVRPFYPGGDYQKERYEKTDIVVDNPPFSIMSEILDFYNKSGIRYFLFGPHLTLFSSSSSQRCTALPVGVTVTYANGANVCTSFVTNLEPKDIRFRSEPRLYKAVSEANDKFLEGIKKRVPKYAYPKYIIQTSFLSALSRYGIDFVGKVEDTMPIECLDSQKAEKKAIYGKGYIISEQLKAEREKAKREEITAWPLSRRERGIIASLSKVQPCAVD